MAVPGRLNGLMEEDDDNDEGEEWVDLSRPQELSPELVDIATAAESGDVEGLRAALENWNGSIDDAVEDGDSALHLVCLYGHLPCVQLLLERRANLEVKDEDGAIPLHDACAGGFTEIVQLLVNSAGNSDAVKRMLNTVDAEGDTPLHHAARGEHLDVVRYLLSVGASYDKINIYGKIPAELSDPGTEVRRVLEDAANNPAVCS
ncbi:BRCA1-associated RING domain protein 1 [Nymphaea thermarum]|nr:BRCA1-associated RING domain protein 1 [Nymphaea thermarum]